jgi:hypothetical protein
MTIAERSSPLSVPSAWLIATIKNPEINDLTAVLGRVCAAMFGGSALTAVASERLLADNRLVEVRALAGPASTISSLVVR